MAERKTKKKVVDDTAVIKEEHAAEVASEAYSEDAARSLDGQLENEQEILPGQVERGADADATVPAEVAAMHTDTVVAQAASGDDEAAAENEAPLRAPKPKKQRSAKYQQAIAGLNRERAYPLGDALELAKTHAYTSFDATIELHARLLPKKKDDTALRALIQLPHGSGKSVKVAVLTDELIAEIASAKKTDYELLIATPSMMPKVAKIAKILGPQGKMPSPKAGTVTDAPDDALKAFQSGRLEVRADTGGNVHLPIGKASWDVTKLRENAETVIASLPRPLLAAVTVAATMGPGVRVNLTSL